MSVTPASVSVAVSRTVQLTATPKDASGNPLSGRVVTWATSNAGVAMVSASGLVTGVAVGTDTITATSEGQAGRATVSVTALAGTVLFQEAFSDTALGARGWFDNTQLTLDATQPSPGSTAALLIHFLSGATTPTFGAGARHLFAPSATLYVSFWVRHSASWVGSEQPSHPHLFYILSTADVATLGNYSGLAANYLDTYLEENYPSSTAGGAYGRVETQDAQNINTTHGAVPNNLVGVTETRDVSGCNGVPDGFPASCYGDTGAPTGYNNTKVIQAPTLTFTDATKTSWHHVEVYLAMNSITSGTANFDGIVRYWLDGVLQLEHTNVQFRTGAHATLAWQEFVIAPYIGIGSPVDQSLWIDSLTVATNKP